MSLKNPERVSVSKDSTLSETQSKIQKLKTQTQSESIETGSSEDGFVLPEHLKQYFVITPCKLRLVTLLTFVLSKYKVSEFLN